MATATVADLDAKISKHQDAKSAFLEKSRAEGRALSRQRDRLVAEEAATAKVEAMSPAERQAIAAELARVDGSGS